MKTNRSIHKSPVVPHIIAGFAIDTVLKEDKRCKDFSLEKVYDIHQKSEDLLSERAEKLYEYSDSFRKKIDSNKTDCRAVLKMFMEHWFKELLDQYLRGAEVKFRHA